MVSETVSNAYTDSVMTPDVVETITNDRGFELDQTETIVESKEKPYASKLSREQPEEDESGWSTAAENPLNWSRKRKWKSALVVSFYTFVR